MHRSQSSSLFDRIRVNPREKQRLMDSKLQLQEQEQQRGPATDSNTQLKSAHQKIALLTAELKRCQIENETVRASFLSHVEASRKKNRANEEIVERLRLENKALRGLRRGSFSTVAGCERAASLEDSAASTISELTLDEIIQGDTKDRGPGPLCPDQAIKFNERMRASSLHSIPKPHPGLGNKFNPFVHDLVVNDEDSVESMDGQGVSERAAPRLTKNTKDLTKLPARCQSEGLLVGFGGNETRKNDAANTMPKTRMNRQTSSADESGGLPADPAQNSTWGLIRPNKPQLAAPNASQNPFWGLTRSLRHSYHGGNPKDATTDSGVLPSGSSQSKNSTWDLIRPNQDHSHDKNPQDQPTDSTLDSTYCPFATSKAFKQDIKFGNTSGMDTLNMDPEQDIDFAAMSECSVIRDFLEFADSIGDDGPENSDKPFVKAPIARCRSDDVGFGDAARWLSSLDKPNQHFKVKISGDLPADTAQIQHQNATWGFIRPNRLATAAVDVPRDLPHFNTKNSSHAPCNSEAPRLSHVSEESNGSVPTRCSSEGLLVGFGGTEIRRNGAAKLLSSLQKSENQSYTGKITEDMPVMGDVQANPPQNSTWGLRRPNKQSSSNERWHDLPTNSSQNSTWALIRASKNETLDSIKAKLLQSKLNPASTPEEGIKLGTAGDDWSAAAEDADKDAKEEGIRRMVSERSLRRQKTDAAPRKGTENAFDKGRACSNPANGQSEAQRAECRKNWSSLIGLDQYQHQRLVNRTQDGMPGMMRGANSLASIPEKPRARFSHRQARRRGDQEQRSAVL